MEFYSYRINSTKSRWPAKATNTIWEILQACEPNRLRSWTLSSGPTPWSSLRGPGIGFDGVHTTWRACRARDCLFANRELLHLYALKTGVLADWPRSCAQAGPERPQSEQELDDFDRKCWPPSPPRRPNQGVSHAGEEGRVLLRHVLPAFTTAFATPRNA